MNFYSLLASYKWQGAVDLLQNYNLSAIKTGNNIIRVSAMVEKLNGEVVRDSSVETHTGCFSARCDRRHDMGAGYGKYRLGGNAIYPPDSDGSSALGIRYLDFRCCFYGGSQQIGLSWGEDPRYLYGHHTGCDHNRPDPGSDITTRCRCRFFECNSR